jgi:putative membrane-bound dehydrogenase-like protein
MMATVSGWRIRSGRWPLRMLGMCAALICSLGPNIAFHPVVQADEPVGIRDVPPPDPPPLSPEESLRSIEVREGYQVELMAAEPLLMDPVAIDWGPDGRLWVAEMADYPSGMDGHGKPGGRVRFLTDSDGDGQYDKSQVFVENLPFPTAVTTWRNGILITAAPDVLYAEDRDGDGSADEVKSLFKGFLEGNQQLRVNGLRWGLDNWVYCASGAHYGGYGADKVITAQQTGEQIPLGSHDFRFDPATGRLEPLSGPSQYGRNRDDWGHWFGVQNSHPIWHYVLEDRYIRRNPHFAYPDPAHKLLPANPPVYAAKPAEKRFHSFEQTNRFTSACSATIYRDRLLFAGMNSFTCEPFHNLVQHLVLQPAGSSFSGARDASEQPTDFFASADRWCRPVMATTGPDGALWIADMYRFMIEHPEWLPAEGKAELEPYYRAGDDRGRIYRVFPIGRRPAQIATRLDALAPAELVARLESPNGWQRDMAQRLIVQRGDPAIAPALKKLAAESAEPLARLHALYALAGLHQLEREQVFAGLRDSHPELRRNAIWLIEELGWKDDPQCFGQLVGLADDPDPKVRLQLACTLGAFTDPSVGEVLGRLALRDADDAYCVAAVASSATSENLRGILHTLVQSAPQGSGPQKRMLSQFISMAARFGQRDLVAASLRSVLDPSSATTPAAWQFETLSGALDAVQRELQVAQLILEPDFAQRLSEFQDAARTVVSDRDAPMELRIAAVGMLLRDPHSMQDDQRRLVDLLDVQTPSALQSACVARLAMVDSQPTAESLLDRWPTMSPGVRQQIVDTMLSREAWTEVLLSRLASGAMPSSEIDAATRQRFLQLGNEALRAKATELLSLASSADRGDVVHRYAAAQSLVGDASRGAAVFEKKCASCHRLGEVGQEVGPNLLSLSDRSPAALLPSILDPSRAFDSNYAAYVATTVDGRVLTGMIVGDTGASLTLVGADGRRQELLRTDLEDLRSTSKSLMPDGLEQDLAAQDLADVMRLIAESPNSTP